MQLLVYYFILAIQLVAIVGFVRAAQGHRVAILEAEGAIPLTPAGGWIRALGSTAAAALMVIGLVTSRWIGWDIGVMVMVLFFFLEVRRLRKWSGPSKVFTYVISALVLLFSLVDLLDRLL